MTDTVAIVCGGRDYQDYARVQEVLDQLRPMLVIHGAARGADSLAQRWCKERRMPETARPADWDRYGKAAGMIRNQEMLDLLLLWHGLARILVVAFPGGRGTAGMVGIARRAGVEVMEIT